VSTDGFIQYLTSEKRYSSHTISSYAADLEQFSTFMHSHYELEMDAARPEWIRSWIADMLSEGKHPNTVHRKLSSLSAYYKYCMISNLRNDNPCAGIKKPKRPTRLPMFLDSQATQRLYDIISGLSNQCDFGSIRDAVMLRLLIETGMRRAELIELNRSDIDFSYKRIRVLGKRNKVRLIPISEDFLKSISRYITERDAIRKDAECIQLLLNDRGQKMSTNFVHQKINNYLATITTIKKKSPHVMRHSFATGMLNNGADLQAIRELLGHTSLAATQVYTHNSISKLRQIHYNKHPRS